MFQCLHEDPFYACRCQRQGRSCAEVVCVLVQEAFTRMQSVKALAKAVSKDMAESLKSQEEQLQLALTKAQRDNNTVYLERVPPFAGKARLHCMTYPLTNMVHPFLWCTCPACGC